MNKKIGLGLHILLSLAMTASAIAKFVMPAQKEMDAFPTLTAIIKPLGALELAIVALWLLPKTMKPGFYLLCSYLGGAICAHVFMGEPPFAPAILLTLAWIAMYLRDRSMAESKL
jgi:hypothetical protein